VSELTLAQERVQKLEEENRALKNRKLTLADLANGPDNRGLQHIFSRTGGAATAPAAPSVAESCRSGGKGVKRGYATSVAGSAMTSVKDEGLTIVNEFSESDLKLYRELERQVMACWKAPGTEAMYETKGMRPLSLTEVEDLAKKDGYTVEEELNWFDPTKESWTFYRQEKGDTPAKGIAGNGFKYPPRWPRKARTKRDDLVKERKIEVLLALSRLVKNNLGNQSDGPPDGRTLHEFLMEVLTNIWEAANQPVTTSMFKLSPKTRNSYLTTLLAPAKVSWGVVKNVMTAMWPVIESAEWNKTGRILFWEEKQALEAKALDDTPGTGTPPATRKIAPPPGLEVLAMDIDDEVSSIAVSETYKKLDDKDF